MGDTHERATVADVGELAAGMPHVTVEYGNDGRKSFVFFRTPQPDAVDPAAGERYDDVIVFWVPTEADNQVLVQDAGSSFFTTPHSGGHLSVLVRPAGPGS